MFLMDKVDANEIVSFDLHKGDFSYKMGIKLTNIKIITERSVDKSGSIIPYSDM